MLFEMEGWLDRKRYPENILFRCRNPVRLINLEQAQLIFLYLRYAAYARPYHLHVSVCGTASH